MNNAPNDTTMNERKKVVREAMLRVISTMTSLNGSTFSCIVEALPNQLVNAPRVEGMIPYSVHSELSEEDEQWAREIFWDLFREKVVTLGADRKNSDFPWFKLHSEYRP